MDFYYLDAVNGNTVRRFIMLLLIWAENPCSCSDRRPLMCALVFTRMQNRKSILILPESIPSPFFGVKWVEVPSSWMACSSFSN